jgi:hypothetical protein
VSATLGRLKVPAEYRGLALRFGEIEVRPDRDAFEIAEVRTTATWINSVAWGNDDATEPGVAIARCSMAMQSERGLVEAWMPRAIVTLHALGRWFERTDWGDHDRLLADLAVLGLAPDGGEDERVPTPDGGCWLGPMEVMTGTVKLTVRARNVRTWVDG